MRILVPIDFSTECVNILRYANAIAQEKSMQLNLINCYPERAYERKYDFSGQDYREGIREMLVSFYDIHIDKKSTDTQFIAHPGSKSDILIQLSSSYDLIVVKGYKFHSTWARWLSDGSSSFAVEAKCPVLIMPSHIEYHKWNNIWHINRMASEEKILRPWLTKLRIEPAAVQVKSLQQTTFSSVIWKSIVQYVEQPSTSLYQDILNQHPSEKIQLFILVSHKKETFMKFLVDEATQIIFQFGIPVLIIQNPSIE